MMGKVHGAPLLMKDFGIVRVTCDDRSTWAAEAMEKLLASCNTMEHTMEGAINCVPIENGSRVDGGLAWAESTRMVAICSGTAASRPIDSRAVLS